MAQNITIQGASYSDVPAVTLPKTGGGTASFTDVTGTTATASDVASGKIFYASDGTQTTGTASGGGGASSWTLVASTSYQVSTTSTSAATVATWATGHSEIWTSDQIVYVKIRDTAGKRAGYFYGSDNYLYNYIPINSAVDTSINFDMRIISKYSTNGLWSTVRYTASTGYGVYADIHYSDGRIRIRSRYHSSYSLAIGGTYSVEVYLLTPPSAIFE